MLFIDVLKKLISKEVNITNRETFLNEYQSLFEKARKELSVLALIQYDEIKVIYEHINLIEEVDDIVKKYDTKKWKDEIYDLYIENIGELDLNVFTDFCISIIKSFGYKCNIDNSTSGNYDDFVIENGVLKKYTGNKMYVNIPDGVKQISKYAFYGNINIRSVVLSNSVRVLSEDAFSNCKSLVYFWLNDHIRELGNSIFNDSSALQYINVERLKVVGPYAFCNTQIEFDESKFEKLNRVGEFAFAQNELITSISIRKYYDLLGKSIFYRCSNVKKITFGSSDDFYYVFSEDVKDFMRSFTKLEEIEVYTNKVFEEEFAEMGLPIKVKIIGEDITICKNAFKNAYGIKEIEVEGKVSSIGEGAFQGCENLENLQMNYVGKTIPKLCFAGCHSLRDYNFMVNEDHPIENICQKAFFNCNLRGFDFIHVFEKVVKIEAQAFDEPKGISEDLSISFKCIKKLENLALAGLKKINKLLIPSFHPLPDKELYKAFASTLREFVVSYLFEVVIIRCNLYPHCFENYENIKKIKVGNSDNNISDFAFKGCTKLQTVDFFNPIANIGMNSFDGCNKLLEINAEYLDAKIGAFAFKKCTKLNIIEIINHAIYYGDNAFEGCNNITELCFNSRTDKDSIGKMPFSGCNNISKIEMSNCIPLASLFVFNPQSFQEFNKCTPKLREVIINTNNISAGLFANYYNLERIIVKGSKIEIGANAFENCLSLHEVDIEGDVIVFGASAFKGDFNLDDLNIQFVGQCIPDSCFEGCERLDIKLNFENVKEIGNRAFFKCNLENFDFERNLRFINKIGVSAFDESVFDDVVNITLLRIEKIGEFAFKGVKNINKLVITSMSACNNELASVLSYSLANCNNTVHINVLEVLSPMLNESLLGYKCVDEVVFASNGITARNIFENSAVKKITIKGRITGLSDEVFKNCTQLETLVIDNLNYNIGNEVFYNCYNLTKVYVLENGDYVLHSFDDLISQAFIIGNRSFAGTAIKDVKINPLLKELGTEVFDNCKDLSSISMYYHKTICSFIGLFGQTKQPELYAISRNGINYYIPKALKTIIITGGEIDNDTFKDFASFENVELRDGASFDAEAFMGCIRVQKIYIDKTISKFDSSVFKLLADNVELTIDKNNETYCLYENSMYSIDYQTLYYCFDGQQLIINENTKYMETGALRSWNRLESVRLLKGLNVKEKALIDLFNLKELIIEENCNIANGMICYDRTNHKNDFSLKKLVIDTPSIFPHKLRDLFAGEEVKLEVVEEIEINNMNIDKDFFEGFIGVKKLTINGKSVLKPAALNYLNLDELKLSLDTKLSNKCFGNMCVFNATIPMLIDNGGLDYLFNEGTQSFNCLEEVHILSGTINKYAFSSFDHLKKIYLEDGVEKISENSFSNSFIDNLYIAASVNEIEECSFVDSNISKIILPKESIYRINEYGLLVGNGVVYYALDKTIRELVLGKDITDVTTRSLQNLNLLETVIIANDNINLADKVFDKVMNVRKIEIGVLSNPPKNVFDETYQQIREVDFHGNMIPDEYFKDFVNLEKITFLKNVKSIGVESFKNDINLQSIDLSENVEEIGNNAFSNCERLKKVIFGSKIEKIGKCILSGTSALEELSFDNNLNLNITRIGELFSDIDFERSYGVMQGGKQYYLPTAFVVLNFRGETLACKSLFENLQMRININSLVGEVGEAAFINCQNVNIKTAKNVTQVDTFAFMNSNVVSLDLSGCKSIQADCFVDTRQLDRIIFDAALESINVSAFKNSAIRNIEINNNDHYYTSQNLIIDKANHAVIYGLKESLEKDIIIPSDVKIIQENSMEGMKFLETLRLPKVEAVDQAAFKSCPKLYSVEFSNKLNKVSDAIFKNTPITKLIIPFIGRTAKTQEGLDYLFDVPNSENQIKEITVLQKITSEETFKDLAQLEKITLDRSQDTITKEQFSGCRNLKEFTFSEDLMEIDDGAFKNCVSLKELNLPANEKIKYGTMIFEGCTGLTKLSIPYLSINRKDFMFNELISEQDCNIKELVVNAGNLLDKSFANFESLETIDISNLSMEIVPTSCFENCTNLREVKVSKDVTKIKKFAFTNCVNLLEYPFKECAIEVISLHVFENCNKIKELIINEGLTTVLDNAFKDMISLEKVSIPSTTKDIGAQIFENDVNIKELDIPFLGHKKDDPICFYEFFGEKADTIVPVERLNILSETIIKTKCFESNNVIQLIQFQANPIDFGESVFANCSELQIVSFEQPLSSIPNYSFKNCVRLERCNIDGLKTIGDEAFMNCQILKEIDGSEVKKLGVACFMDSGIETIEIGGNLKSVAEKAFANSAITNITLPETTEKIDAEAFVSCRNLDKIIIPYSVKYIGPNVFYKSSPNLMIYLRDPDVINAFDSSWNSSSRMLLGKKTYKNIKFMDENEEEAE